jgi:hypothetical protein
MQLHTLLGMQAEDILHLHSYAFDVLLEEMCYRCFYSKFIHILIIQKCSSMLNRCLIELVVQITRKNKFAC